MAKSILIYNARLLDESMDTLGAVLVLNGKIRSVFQGNFSSKETVEVMAKAVLKEEGIEDSDVELIDAKGLTITPSFIDMHVHFRYPGQTQKEDLHSGLEAAASGGYGTVVCMPNTNPVVSSMELAKQIEDEAKEIGLCNLYQTVSITKDFNGEDTSHLDNLDQKYIPVITEDGHDVLSSSVMKEGMTKAGKKGIIVACHSEDPTLAVEARPYRQKALEIMKKQGLSAWGTNDDDIEAIDLDDFDTIFDSLTEANNILALAEDVATIRNIMLAKQADCHVHICHVSTANAINAIRDAKEDLLDEQQERDADDADTAYDAFEEDYDYFPTTPNPYKHYKVTCEVTPHHLALCGTDEPYIRALVNPPLRSEDDRIAILDALRDGTVDVISTDHAPHTSEDKVKGAPGFTGIETSYGVCHTVLVLNNGFEEKKLSSLMSANPARLLNLKKGLLREGYDADLTLLDPDEEWIVDSSKFYSKGKATPFEGKKLTGKVHSLFINGDKVFENK